MQSSLQISTKCTKTLFDIWKFSVHLFIYLVEMYHFLGITFTSFWGIERSWKMVLFLESVVSNTLSTSDWVVI